MWKKYNKVGGGGVSTNAAQTGRRSVCGDDSHDDLQQESELYRLRQQIRLMEADRHVYRQDTWRILRKQQQEIKNLKNEREEMDTVMQLAKRELNLYEDECDIEELFVLLDEMDMFTSQCKAEKQRIQELSGDIMSLQEQILFEKKLMIGRSNENEMTRDTTKRLKVTENRLNQEQIKFSNQLTLNARLRGELDVLRKDKGVFDAIYKKLSKRIDDTKKEIDFSMRQATQAYEEREEKQNKMVALKERNDKDMCQQEMDMKELLRIIKHDDMLKQFMGIKMHDRADLKEEERVKSQKGKVSGDKVSDYERQTIKQVEAAFDKIMTATGENDIDTIVTNFIKKEDQNFALYNYVNELNDTIVRLQGEMNDTKQDIVRFQEEDVNTDETRIKLMREMQILCDKFRKESEELDQKNKRVCRTVDVIRDGISKLFADADCDSSSICDMLGSEKGVTNKNILQYMGIIEQRTMELLQSHQLIQMEKEPVKAEKDSKGQPIPQGLQYTRTASPRMVPVAIVAPNSADSEDILEEGDLRPLNQNEIRYFITRTLDTKIEKGEEILKRSSDKRQKVKSANV